MARLPVHQMPSCQPNFDATRKVKRMPSSLPMKCELLALTSFIVLGSSLKSLPDLPGHLANLGKLTIVRGVVLFAGRVLKTMPSTLLVAGGYTVLHLVRCSKLGESTCKTKSSPMNAPGMK